jgi:hypothetical protein
VTVSQFECQTQEGPFLVQFSKSGLSQVSFPVLGAETPTQNEALDDPGEIEFPLAWLDLTYKAIRDGVLGQPLGDLPPLDLQGTPFQRSVWMALLSIPCGKTRSYGQIAAEDWSSRSDEGRWAGLRSESCASHRPLSSSSRCWREIGRLLRRHGLETLAASPRRVGQRRGSSFIPERELV